MKTETKKSNRKTKYTTDYEFWLKHKDEYFSQSEKISSIDEYIYIKKSNNKND